MELHNNRIDNDRTGRRDLERSPTPRAGDMESSVDHVSDSRAVRQEQVKELTEQAQGHRTRVTDSLDLSAAARLFTGEARDSDRAALVQSLRSSYEGGNLNTRERMERAAHNLLAGE